VIGATPSPALRVVKSQAGPLNTAESVHSNALFASVTQRLNDFTAHVEHVDYCCDGYSA
jgi:hypothetical protein